MTNEPQYTPLIKYKRNGLTEQLHCGLILHLNKNGIISKIGEDNGYKFYHRSCMKPLQFSPVIDLKLDEKYKLTEKEIAVCCASHTGEQFHQKEIYSVLNKTGLSEDDLLCPPHEPLSKNEQKRLIIAGEEFHKIHNNCSGKHTAMLMLCKELGFDKRNYTDLNHPLSDFIINKICGLCETDKNDVIISKDGCGLPVIATSLEVLGRGFLNLFCNPKYEKIKQAFLNNPYYIGGYGRLDSEIINAGKNLVAKVGACGLCVVVNTEKEEALVVKIADSDMEARSITVINAMLQLKWPAAKAETDQNNIYRKNVVSQTGEILGVIEICFNFN